VAHPVSNAVCTRAAVFARDNTPGREADHAHEGLRCADSFRDHETTGLIKLCGFFWAITRCIRSTRPKQGPDWCWAGNEPAGHRVHTLAGGRAIPDLASLWSPFRKLFLDSAQSVSVGSSRRKAGRPAGVGLSLWRSVPRLPPGSHVPSFRIPKKIGCEIGRMEAAATLRILQLRF
jgi:hypothetical protein